MKYIPLILLFVMGNAGYAQKTHIAQIDKVPQNGYYNVELSQEIIAISGNLDFSNVRIKDDNNKETPYFVRSDSPIIEMSRFINYPIVSNTVKDSVNTVVIENAESKNLDRFYIVIASADVNKYVRLRGSNDQKQWYIVKKEETIYNAGFKEANNEYLMLDFPSGNYKYYEITLSNNQNSPLKIEKVGRFENANIYTQLTEINLGKLVQKDSTNKKTYLYFPNLAYNYLINKLTFDIGYKGDYVRRSYIENEYSDFNLSSKNENAVYLSAIPLSANKAIVIENNDSPPLVISSIKAFGLNRYLCVYLEANKPYKLTIEDSNTPMPDYDIQHFKNDIPQNLAIIKTTNLTSKDIVVVEREKIWIEKPLFLWSVIILLGLFLSGICWKVMQDMKKRK